MATLLHFCIKNPPTSRLGGALGRLVGVLGHLGGVLKRLGAVLGRLGVSWGRLGASRGRLGAKLRKCYVFPCFSMLLKGSGGAFPYRF